MTRARLAFAAFAFAAVGAPALAQAQTITEPPAAPPAVAPEVAPPLFAPAAPEAPPEAASESGLAVSDPLEGWNRLVFSFNDGLDYVALRPIARGYRAITPKFARTGVSNFLSNFDSPVTFANDVLQGKPKRAGTTLARFGVNTTLGVAGLFDVASKFGLEEHQEDFGQTLGAWGVGSGPYLVLPLLGPSNLRDFAGWGVDMAFQPLNYANGEDAPEGRVGKAALTIVSVREANLETVEDLRKSSPDFYVSVRTAYAQARKSSIKDGHESVEDLPDFGGSP